MRTRLAALSTALALLLTAPALAQQLRQGGQGAPPPAAAKPGPYKPIAVKLPAASTDASLAAFRKELGDIAQKKDKAALTKLLVGQQAFFWFKQQGDGADKRKPAIANLTAALDLDNKDGAGWEALGAYASDPTTMPFPDKAGAVCSPAFPQIGEKDIEEMGKATKTDPSQWAYPAQAGVEVRDKADAKGAVVDKLGMNVIWMLPDEAAGDFIKVVTPGGKVGFVAADAMRPLFNDQLCYVKEGANWKITGYIGGE